MLQPILPLDYELTTPGELPVAGGYRTARLLVRMHGVPVGIVEVPVVTGAVRPGDVGTAVLDRLRPPLGRELARHALSGDGIRGPVEFADHEPPPPLASPPAITVAVCTRDRPDDLARCLGSLERLRVSPLEVIVVDNAPSSEATRELARSRFPAVRYVREDAPGLDHARNRAIAEARGEIIAFTDDDVTVDPGWTEALGRIFAEDPAVGLVTGLIEPAELETEAQILFERYGGFGRGCARNYLQSRPGAPLAWNLAGAGQLGAGANMAVRRELFERVGRFDPALDVGTPTLGGGDHEIFFRCLRSGMICLYEPTAIVRHRHRRTMSELSKLLHSYGFGTRCFFEREAAAFPGDRPALRKLARWWWRHWAWARWWRAAWTPSWFPRELVEVEIRGYREGKHAYRRAREAIVPDEMRCPDAFLIELSAERAGPGGVGLVTVDVARPLRPLVEGLGRDALEVMVQWQGRPLGRVRIGCSGAVVVPSRLADAIARSLWLEIVTTESGNPSLAWAAKLAGFQQRLEAANPPARDRSAAGVSVIVATCGRPAGLRRCLGSIFAMKVARHLQVIVVDNRPGSGGTCEVLDEFPRVELVEEARPGSSYARNAGVAAAREEIVAMTDDDMEVSEDWLERLVAPFTRADVAAVTGQTLPASLENAAELEFEAYGGFGRGCRARVFDKDWFHRSRYRALQTWKIGGTGNVAFRREIFDDPGVGAFEECLGSGVPSGVGEDTLWFYEILKSGRAIQYEPAAVAWHHHRATRRELRKQLAAYARGHVAYHLLILSKHRDKRSLTRLCYELPAAFASRFWKRISGANRYPWPLLVTEITGTLLGPWALWRSKLHVRKHGPGARPEKVTGGGA